MFLTHAQTNNNKAKNLAIGLYLALVIPVSSQLLFFVSKGASLNLDNVTFSSVPISVLMEFVRDETAREAYLKGDKIKLHYRLKQLGFEEKIKDFYRSNFANEAELDKYIHQIFYQNTGYVGEAYQVNEDNILVNREYKASAKPHKKSK